MKLLALLLLLPSFAHAGLFLELGIAKADSKSCIQDYDDNGVLGCSDSPLGNATIGYTYKGFTAEIEHWSSLVERDRGLNLLTLKYRWNLTK
jgi:hypothetical protein